MGEKWVRNGHGLGYKPEIFLETMIDHEGSERARFVYEDGKVAVPEHITKPAPAKEETLKKSVESGL